MLDIPYEQQRDPMACAVAVYTMVARYFFPELTHEKIAKIAKWEPGYVVWEFAFWKWLLDQGIYINLYETLDYESWVNKGLEGLKASVSEKEFKYHQYTVYDDNKCSIDNVLKQAYEAVMKYDKKTNILIHCFMGASRSVSVVAYYLMLHKKFTLDSAYKFIREKRSSINPTFRFTKDLAKSQMIGTKEETKVNEVAKKEEDNLTNKE